MHTGIQEYVSDKGIPHTIFFLSFTATQGLFPVCVRHFPTAGFFFSSMNHKSWGYCEKEIVELNNVMFSHFLYVHFCTCIDFHCLVQFIYLI